MLSGEAGGVAKDSTGIVEAIRQLAVARDGAMKARSAALCQFGDLVVTAPTDIRERLAVRKTLEAKAALCRRMRTSPTGIGPAAATRIALRSLA